MIETLEELYNSEGFSYFISDKLGNNLFINDPERADRIHEAAKESCDGSTHQETIEDWREYLEIYFSELLTPNFASDGEEEGWEALKEENKAKIEDEIATCEAFHEKNGTLNETP